MQLPDSSAVPFANNLRRMGGVPTQPRQNNPVAPAQRPAGQTPWGAPQQQHQGGRGGFGQPNPQGMAQKPWGGSPWSLANQNPKQAQMLANGQSPFPGFEPQTGGPNFQFPRPDAIPPGPPGGSYGPGEIGNIPRPQAIIPPGPAGQSYGPVEDAPGAGSSFGFGFGVGPYNPEAKPGQITGAQPGGGYVDPMTGQIVQTGASPFNIGGPSPWGAGPFGPPQYQTGGGAPFIGDPGPIWAPVLGGLAGGVGNYKPSPIPPGPAGQSYGPVEGGKPPVDRSWLRTEGLRRPNIDEAY